MARGEPPRSGPPLPAPYRSPWSGLAEALRAVGADLRLRLQRLWRRNREGELWRPGFWPGDLAPLFWPVLLALAVALVIGLGSRLTIAVRPLRPAADGAAPAEAQPAVEELASPARQDTRESSVEPRPDEPIRSLEPQAPSPATAAEASGPGQPTAASQPSGDAGASDASSLVAAPALQLDPLLELLSAGDDARLLLAARPDPASSRLSLTLSESGEALPPTELLERAQRWQQQAREAGYERLELRDANGRLRGRGALVGSGMILLAPAPAS